MDPVALARSYYRALDDHAYDDLADLLAADFVHDRPDRRLEGRDRFVRFMREERPQTETSHPVDDVFVTASDDYRVSDADSDGDDVDRVAVRGRLLDADGDRITVFVDVFTVADGRLVRIDTFTH